MLPQLKEAYGFIFEKELIAEIEKNGVLKSTKKVEIITAMPLLIEGAIKILREDNEGNIGIIHFGHIMLYWKKFVTNSIVPKKMFLGQKLSSLYYLLL